MALVACAGHLGGEEFFSASICCPLFLRTSYPPPYKMARSEEKAKSSLSRWISQQKSENGQAPQKAKRPYLASLCDNLKDAIKWRGQILREVASQVTLIQNGAY